MAGDRSVSFDEDALAGTFLGGLDDRVELAVGDVGEALGATGVREHLVALFDVGEAVVEQGEDVGRDLLAEPVAGAQILVDPDLHSDVLTFGLPRAEGKRTQLGIYHTAV